MLCAADDILICGQSQKDHNSNLIGLLPRQENMADHGTNGPRNFFGPPERKEEERKKQQGGKKEGEEEKERKREGEKKKEKKGKI